MLVMLQAKRGCACYCCYWFYRFACLCSSQFNFWRQQACWPKINGGYAGACNPPFHSMNGWIEEAKQKRWNFFNLVGLAAMNCWMKWKWNETMNEKQPCGSITRHAIPPAKRNAWRNAMAANTQPTNSTNHTWRAAQMAEWNCWNEWSNCKLQSNGNNERQPTNCHSIANQFAEIDLANWIWQLHGSILEVNKASHSI